MLVSYVRTRFRLRGDALYMRQVFQNLDDGVTHVEEVPAPAPRPGHLLVRTRASVVSAGTERMLVEFGRANLLEKARQQPERVRQVFDKMATDGIRPTIEAVRAKLSEPIALGYAAAGEVIDVGRGVQGFGVGDRVATNGPHAEVVSVPANLCAKIPSDEVSYEEAAFTPLVAIALQGLRLAEPTLGERFVVTGLGLIGLLAVQLLKAQGCQVLGIDPQSDRLELARQFGAETVDIGAGEDPIVAAERFSGGDGADGVIIAAATDSNEPVRQAATMCRKRGRIVLVGVVGLELERQPFFEKELSFQVSCSYGPGRYDPAYEEGGHDYPQGFVRWTAGRNFEAVLDLMATGRLDVLTLVTSRFELGDATSAYEELAERSPLGILLEYPKGSDDVTSRTVFIRPRSSPNKRPGNGVLAVIGAGNYARRTLLPALVKADAQLEVIASRGGSDAAAAAKQFGFRSATTQVDSVLDDHSIDTIVIATRHDSHAALTIRGLEAGKHVFVEKPLALTLNELEAIEKTYSEHADQILCVGFNRRFAPLIRELMNRTRNLLGPRATLITVNAGHVPRDHWIHDPHVGGGRIVGEGCHFIDLARAVTRSPITGVRVQFLGVTTDSASILLDFSDGSTATVHYLAEGAAGFPKERVELFGNGETHVIENFRRIRSYSAGISQMRDVIPSTQDKGHGAMAQSFLEGVRSGRAPIPINELFESSSAAITAQTVASST